MQTKRPTKKKPAVRIDVASADKSAARALAAMDERPSTQLTAIAALEILRDSCERDVIGSVLAREVRRLLDERRASIKAFHLERAARAVDAHALAGDAMREPALRSLADALHVVQKLEGESADVRTLRVRLDDVTRGRSGRPRPFFARYLEHQRR